MSTARDAEAREAVAAALGCSAQPSVVTIGTFDGVHHGHRALVGVAGRIADAKGMPLYAVTFSPRPEQVLRPASALPDICALAERVRRLRAAGADRVVVIPFSAAVASLSAEAFTGLLRDRLAMRVLCVGSDFRLGRGRSGTPEQLRALGIDVFEHGLVPNAPGTAKASSTAVRRAIAAGARPEAALAIG